MSKSFCESILIWLISWLFKLLVVETSIFALLMVTEIENGNVPLSASLPIKILPPWFNPFSSIFEFWINVFLVADIPIEPPRPFEPLVWINAFWRIKSPELVNIWILPPLSALDWIIALLIWISSAWEILISPPRPLPPFVWIVPSIWIIPVPLALNVIVPPSV